jgi:NADP-dependent 3-hydroxy acid dehydrogenase YdfG
MEFNYKHVLMIGATSGIGYAMAERLVEAGCKVTVVGRRKERLDEFVAKHGEEKASDIPFDIGETDKAPQFAKELVDFVFLLCEPQTHTLPAHHHNPFFTMFSP